MFPARLSLLRVTLFAFVALGAVSPVAAQDHTIPLNPKATYLRTISGDVNALPAVPIDLDSFGFQSGNWLAVIRIGEFQFGGAVNGESGSMVAVFSSTDELDDRQQAHRVPGAIDAGQDVTTLETSPTLPTDIPEDFGIAPPGIVLVKIPAGARYLFVSPNDSFFGDNTDVDNDYSIRIIRLQDSDGDDVPNPIDQCVNSDMRPLVDTGSGPTSVTNVVDATGCTIQDYVNAYQVAAKNHGAYVSSITRLADRLFDAGKITGAQKGELVSGAGRSGIGKSH